MGSEFNSELNEQSLDEDFYDKINCIPTYDINAYDNNNPLFLDDFITNTNKSENISENKLGKFKKKIFEISKEQRDKKEISIKKEIKAGRKRKREIDDENNGKTHTKDAYDNINRKIQVHFINFLIDSINEILENNGIKKKFLDIDYNIKKNVKNVNVENLKTKEIGQILCEDISTKNKNQYKIDKTINKNLYSEIIKKDAIRKILSEKYINIFNNIYYKNKRDLNDYGLNIKLSNKVKTYQDLLDKNNKNSEYIEKINIFVKEYYLPKFVIQKYI